MTLDTVFDYFANSLWQVPLLAACCWCALRLARASAGVRYAAWIATLLLCVTLPWRGAPLTAQGTVTVTTGYTVVASDADTPAPALPFYAVRIKPRTRDLLAKLYLGLIVFFVLRLMFSYASQRRLVAQAGWLSVDQEAKVSLLGADAARVRVLPAGHGSPMVAGIWRPRVLLPEALFTVGDETLRAVLAHEFAHLARRDTLVNLALRIVALPVAYHPATAMVEREIQHSRELLCDAMAARSLSSATAYAQALLRLAQEIVHTGGEVPRSTVGLFARTSKPLLEERIMDLIAPPAPVRFGFRTLRVCAASGLLCAAVATVSIVHLTPSVLAAEQQAPAIVAPTIPAIATPTRDNASKQRSESKPTATQIRRAKAALNDVQLQHELQAMLKEKNVTTADLNKELADLRVELNSPEMKKQLQAVHEIDVMAISDAITQSQKELAAARKQLNSPEFKQQMKEAKATVARAQADLPRLVAEAQQQALLAHASAPQDTDPVARVSGGIMEGAVSYQVQPVYPAIAKAAGVSGTVIFRAIIAKDRYRAKPDVYFGAGDAEVGDD